MRGIIVGIDGSPRAEAALAFALEEARLRTLLCGSSVRGRSRQLKYAGAAFNRPFPAERSRVIHRLHRVNGGRGWEPNWGGTKAAPCCSARRNRPIPP